MMRKRAICLLLAAIFALSAGCYDEGSREDCVGFSCPYGLQWPDGGEVRMWYIRLPDGTAIRRLMGYFHTADEGPPPFIIGECAPDPNVFQPAQREYIDVGESITFDMGDTSIDVPRVRAQDQGGMPAVDAYFRQHQIAYLLDTPPGPVGEGFIDGKHSVNTGDQAINPFVRDIYQPPRLNLVNPPPGIPGTPVITLKKGQDVLFEWETESGQDPDAAVGMALVFVPDAMQIPMACIAGNENHFLVPSEVIDGFAADTGFVLVGTATAENELRDDGMMMNKWALTCQLVPWSRVE